MYYKPYTTVKPSQSMTYLKAMPIDEIEDTRAYYTPYVPPPEKEKARKRAKRRTPKTGTPFVPKPPEPKPEKKPEILRMPDPPYRVEEEGDEWDDFEEYVEPAELVGGAGMEYDVIMARAQAAKRMIIHLKKLISEHAHDAQKPGLLEQVEKMEAYKRTLVDQLDKIVHGDGPQY